MATIIYDFETSGLNMYHDDVIEIGCLCVETNEHFTCLVQPLSDKLIDDIITEKTGITNKMLKKEGVEPLVAFKNFFDTLKYYNDMYDNLIMVAHNGRSFDDIFLRRIFRYLQSNGHTEYDIMMSNMEFVDTLELSRLLHPGRKSYSMGSMCAMYNITNESAHRAMGDVNALKLLWKHLHSKFTVKFKDASVHNIDYLTYH